MCIFLMKYFQLLSRFKFHIIFVLIIFIIIFFAQPVKEEKLKGENSLRIFSQEGNLLREFSSPEGSYSIWLGINDFPEGLVKAVLTAEDKRFFIHCGFDPVAILRAAMQDLRYRKIVSGGSTITQQFVRIAYGEVLPSNIILKKFCEIVLAVKLELHCSKKQILECYLNRVPLKFNQNGIPSAARRIFGRDVRFLSEDEISALVVLIRENQPSRDSFRKRMKEIFPGTGTYSYNFDEIEKKVFSTSGYSYNNDESYTPHFEAFLKSFAGNTGGDINTAISNNLNRYINAIINSELKFLIPYNVENCSVVVLRLPGKGEKKTDLVAMVGSQNFHGKISGQVNGCITTRSAGSTLKPFLYGYAMDKLGYRPYTILNDTPLSVSTGNNATYSPKNNDMTYWGPVPLREALACSRNIPAVDTVSRAGVENFYMFLKTCGFNHMDREPSYYGPGLALGTGGASLLQLARSYAGIANGGLLLPVYIGMNGKGDDVLYGKEVRILTEASAFRLIHILSDREARRRAFGRRNFLDFPFDVAAKTGTSKDCRDAWTIGFTNKYVVGVWVGNFSGAQMNGVSGGWGAGRIFHQVIRLVTMKESPSFSYPDSFNRIRFCRRTGRIAGKYCPSSMELADPSDSFPGVCSSCKSGDTYNIAFYTSSDQPEIISPVQGESFIIDPLLPLKRQQIPLKIVLNEQRCDGSSYYYRIDDGGMVILKRDVEKTIDLKKGKHRIDTYKNREIIQAVDFSVE